MLRMPQYRRTCPPRTQSKRGGISIGHFFFSGLHPSKQSTAERERKDRANGYFDIRTHKISLHAPPDTPLCPARYLRDRVQAPQPKVQRPGESSPKDFAAVPEPRGVAEDNNINPFSSFGDAVIQALDMRVHSTGVSIVVLFALASAGAAALAAMLLAKSRHLRVIGGLGQPVKGSDELSTPTACSTEEDISGRPKGNNGPTVRKHRC